MSPDSSAGLVGWDLRPKGAFVALEERGLRIALRRGGRRALFVPYADLTHLDAVSRGAWLGSRRTALLIRRGHFEAADGPEALVQALRRRLAEEPGGDLQLARMLEVSKRAQNPLPRRVTAFFAAICVGVFALQLVDPLAIEAGAFVLPLVREGELWRIVTANFLHGVSLFPVHLLINVLCLLAFGLLVERPLGALRTFLVLSAGAVGAMAGSAAAGYEEVIGASGLVAALAGAVVYLEFAEADRLPAWWRLPRRLFIAVLVLQALVDLALPFIAGAAHLGGFVGGYLAARVLSAGALENRPLARVGQAAVLAASLLLALAFSGAGALILREPDALARHGRRLLAIEDFGPRRLNDLAWRMVTEAQLSPEGLETATALARQAVERSEHANPDILDTLAEVLFVSGDASAAVEAIDEAIGMTGEDEYFREQRRRFTGERAADDRPDPPVLPWDFRKPSELRFEIEDPGLSI